MYQPLVFQSEIRLFEHKMNWDEPKFCVLTRISSSQIDYFPLLALSLQRSDLGNVRMFLVNTDKQTDTKYLSKLVEYINERSSKQNFIVLLDLGDFRYENDYGYDMTDRGLLHLYKQYEKDSSVCEYLLITNADNMYSRNIGRKLRNHMMAKKDIIGWDFVSHHYKPQYQQSVKRDIIFGPEIFDDGTQKCTPTTLQPGMADLGAVIYRFEFLYRHKPLFRYGRETYGFGSDGRFIERVAGLTNTSIILRQTLLVHQ